MKKILFLTPYPYNVAPSQRLKFEQYYTFIENAGFEITQKSFISLTFWQFIYKEGFFFKKIIYTIIAYFNRLMLLFSLPKFDVVYVHLWVTPFGPPFFEYLVLKLSKKVIYDIDDLVYLKNNSHEKKLSKWLKGRQKPIYLMKHAAHVITCTPYLDTFVRQYNTRTTDISSTIDSDRYQVVNTYQNDHKIVLGWSGSHSTAKYLSLLTPVLQRLAKKYSFDLIVMGTADFKIEGVSVISMPWREQIEIETIQKFDIGLYPLPNEQWVHGKSGLKAIQYMGMGIPTVAQKIGEAIERVVIDGENGFLVNGYNEEWYNALSQLIENPALRQQMGTAARAHIVKNYSLQANAEKYLELIGGE